MTGRNSSTIAGEQQRTARSELRRARRRDGTRRDESRRVESSRVGTNRDLKPKPAGTMVGHLTNHAEHGGARWRPVGATVDHPARMDARARLFSDLTNFKAVYAKPAPRKRRSRNLPSFLSFFRSSQLLSFASRSACLLPCPSLHAYTQGVPTFLFPAMADVIGIRMPFPFPLSRRGPALETVETTSARKTAGIF